MGYSHLQKVQIAIASINTSALMICYMFHHWGMAGSQQPAVSEITPGEPLRRVRQVSTSIGSMGHWDTWHTWRFGSGGLEL